MQFADTAIWYPQHVPFQKSVLAFCRMSGPLVLGVIGAGFVFISALLNVLIVRADSPRYKLDLLNTYDQGAEVKKMVRDVSRINCLVAVGASMQLAAVIWQAAR